MVAEATTNGHQRTHAIACVCGHYFEAPFAKLIKTTCPQCGKRLQVNTEPRG